MSDSNLGIKFIKKGSLISLTGHMDEFANYSPLLTMPKPLKLNLSGIMSLNSVGIRKWILFIREFGIDKLELYQCPSNFIDTVNMIPDMVSTTGNMKRIKSVLIPYTCISCRKVTQNSVDMSDLPPRSELITLATIKCQYCAENISNDISIEDHFMFIDVAS